MFHVSPFLYDIVIFTQSNYNYANIMPHISRKYKKKCLNIYQYIVVVLYHNKKI